MGAQLNGEERANFEGSAGPAATGTFDGYLDRYLHPAIVASLISALAIIHYLYLVASPHNVLICFIPDDAFYELQAARHFLATGKWSFDGGFTTTTGFHLLNVYIMALFPRLLTHPWLAIKFWMAVGLILSIVTIFTICHFTNRMFGRFSLIPAFLILTTPSFILSNVGLLEFPFVVMFAALYVTAVFRTHEEARWRALAGIFFLGVLGSLARSDFGGMPLAIFAACAVSFIIKRRKDYLLQSFYGLAGATVGLAAVLLHNVLFSGHCLSGSAMAKALWGQKVGYALFPPIGVISVTLASGQIPFAIIPGIFVIFAAIALVRLRAAAASKSRGSCSKLHMMAARPNDDALLIVAGSGASILYVLVYGADAALQLWYTANFVIPLVLVLGAASRLLYRDHFLRSLMAGTIAVLALVDTVLSYHGIWANQQYMLEMSEYLRNHPVKGQIAGWNVGIVGYFLDGKVVNLDGLMNDQIYPYMRDGTVERYVDAAAIKYILDFPSQITDPRMSKMCGFDSERVAPRLKPVYTVSSKDRSDRWLDYTLFEIEPDRAAVPVTGAVPPGAQGPTVLQGANPVRSSGPA